MNGQEHEHYQELAALAAGGQLPGDEYVDFKSHLFPPIAKQRGIGGRISL